MARRGRERSKQRACGGVAETACRDEGLRRGAGSDAHGAERGDRGRGVPDRRGGEGRHRRGGVEADRHAAIR